MRSIEKRYPIHSKETIRNLVEKNPRYNTVLFSRGYLFTDDQAIHGDVYPFYSNWNEMRFGSRYRLFVHPDETVYTFSQDDLTAVLVGHAYDPIEMISREEELLKRFCSACFRGKAIDTLNQWTGVFVLLLIKQQEITVWNDATCLKSCNYCTKNGSLYLSSHAQLLADLIDEPMSSYARRLRSTKMYNIGMRWMPGFSTPYPSIRRLGTNMRLRIRGNDFTIARFFPNGVHKVLKDQKEFDENTDLIYRILRDSLKLCAEKWNNPAISLTGGMDSRTTLACSAGFTDCFEIFSFDSKDQEKVDSAAAARICEAINHSHQQYHIPDNSSELEDYEILRALILHNTAYAMNPNENEIRKVVYLRNLTHYDVEIKSDIAEVGRAFYEQKYAMKMPEKLNVRQLSILQTKFFFMPVLQRQTDREYRRYVQESNAYQQMFNYEQADIFYWENRVGCASPMTMMNLDPAIRMTFPYNNRCLLNAFLEFPHEMRKNDYPQEMIIKQKMPEIDQQEMKVANLYFGGMRTRAEQLFFKFKSLLYIDREHSV